MSSQTKEKTYQLNQIKENKYSFEASFKTTWPEIKTWSQLIVQ